MKDTEKTYSKKSGENIWESTMDDAKIERAKHWNLEYVSIEKEFAKKHGGVETIDAQEFEKWEDDCASLYRYATESLEDAGIYRCDERDKILESQTEIEAYSGRYFKAREKALKAAVARESDSDRRKKAEDMIRMTYKKVEGHNVAMHDYETRASDPQQYMVNRTLAHNGLIMHLNGLNALAEQYGVRRFTFRDFEPKTGESRGARDMKLEGDRSAAENYFHYAYSEESLDKAEDEERWAEHEKIMTFHVHQDDDSDII